MATGVLQLILISINSYRAPALPATVDGDPEVSTVLVLTCFRHSVDGGGWSSVM